MKFTIDAAALHAGELVGVSLAQEVARRARGGLGARGRHAEPEAPVRRGAGTQQELVWSLDGAGGRYLGVALLISVLDGATWATLTVSPYMPGLRRGILLVGIPAVVLGALAGLPFSGMLPGELAVLPSCAGALLGIVAWLVGAHFAARGAVAAAPPEVRARMDEVAAVLRAMGAQDASPSGAR